MNITTKLYEALKAALPRLAHVAGCTYVRQSSEWDEHGILSFERCDCEIRIAATAIAAYESQQQPAADFTDAVFESCAVSCVDFDANDPRKTVRDLIAWNVQIALDPRVSSQALALIERGRRESLPVVDEREGFERWMDSYATNLPNWRGGAECTVNDVRAAWQARAALSVPAIPMYGNMPEKAWLLLAELHADAGYLFGRVAADGSVASAMATAVRNKINAVHAEFTALATTEADCPSAKFAIADARDAEIAAAHALLTARGVQSDNHDTEADLTVPERIECLIAAHDEATTDLVDDLSDARESGAQDADDARRYRLIRRGQHWSVVDGAGDTLRAEALDAAIDRAMGATT